MRLVYDYVVKRLEYLLAFHGSAAWYGAEMMRGVISRLFDSSLLERDAVNICHISI